MQTIIFCNNKGGVGKTTLALLLINHLSNLGYRVLVSDWDDQCNLSDTIVNDEKFKTIPLYEWLRGRCEIETDGKYEKLVALIGSDDMINLTTDKFEEIKESFSSVAENYDFHIADLPPAVSSRLFMGMSLADKIFIPLTPAPYSLKSANRLFQMMDELDAKEKFCGFVLNMVRPNDKFAQEINNDRDIGPLVVANLPSYRHIERSISHAGNISNDLKSGQNRHARNVIKTFLETLCKKIAIPRHRGKK